MSTVKNIFENLNELAPTWLAEDYDNPGILAGDPDAEVLKVLLALDITAECADEAAQSGAQLVISHHPVIFKPLKGVLSKGVSAPVWRLAHHSLSAICMHTNLDAASGGVNDALAAALELHDVAIAQPYGDPRCHYKKITVFVPQQQAEKVRAAMAAAGAGRLGAYDGCAFETSGSGYFRPLDGARPFIGSVGQAERVDEVRIEAVCEPSLVKGVVSAMLAAHPYEVPAYDIFDDEAVKLNYGMSRVGFLPQSTPLDVFALKVKNTLSAACVKVIDAGKPSNRIALCGGASDSSLIKAAVSSGADTLVTGEMKHSLYLEALGAGINVVEAGHFATENVILPVLQKRLSAAFPQVEFSIAGCNKEPYRSI